MTLRPALPYVLYVIASGLSGLLLEQLLELIDWSGQGWAAFWGRALLFQATATPVALLLARSYGSIGYAGLVATTLVCAVLGLVVSLSVLHDVAVSGDGYLPGTHLFTQILYWPTFASMLLAVVAPMAWLAVLRRHRPGGSGTIAAQERHG